MAKKSEVNNAFYQGVAAIACYVAEAADQPTLAAASLAGHALTLSDFVGIGLPAKDMKAIRRLYRTEAQLKPLAK